MKLTSIEITEQIFTRFPQIALGYVIVESIVNTNTEAINKLIQERLEKIDSTKSLDYAEGVIKWRKIYSQMNARKGKVSSIESLLSMYLKDHKLPDINPVVNYYNALSSYLGIPMGGYDLDKLPHNSIELRQAAKNEEFIPIGGKLIEKTSNGEIVYSNQAIIVCKLWNNKDADISKITPTSSHLLFIFDGADEMEKTKIYTGINILKDELPNYFNAHIIKDNVLDINHPKDVF